MQVLFTADLSNLIFLPLNCSCLFGQWNLAELITLIRLRYTFHFCITIRGRSENVRGWQGPLWVIWSNPPAEAGSPRSFISRYFTGSLVSSSGLEMHVCGCLRWTLAITGYKYFLRNAEYPQVLPMNYFPWPTTHTHTRESAAMLFTEATFQIPSLRKTLCIDRLVTEQTQLNHVQANNSFPSCSVVKPCNSRSCHLILFFFEGEEGDDCNFTKCYCLEHFVFLNARGLLC